MREPIHSGKVSEATLSRSIAVSVIGILLCMICLVGTTWAWYSLSVESGSNEMVGANFDFTVTVTKAVQPSVSPEETEISPDFNDGYYTVENEENAIYRVTLTKKGTATKGFCKVISIEDSTGTIIGYYAVDFATDVEQLKPVSFVVTGSGKIKFIPMLGTPAGDYTEIPSEGIALTPNPAAVSATPPPKSETQPDETGSPTDGEKGTSEGNTTEGGQIPPYAEETPSGGTPENSEPAENQGNSEPAEQPSETPTEEATEES